MLYLFESEIPKNKSVFLSLTYIYGLGKIKSALICKQLGFLINLKVKILSNKQINQVFKNIKRLNINLGSNLKKNKKLLLKTSIFIKSYKGLRKLKNLPIRGQRTHSNAKTSKKKSKK